MKIMRIKNKLAKTGILMGLFVMTVTILSGCGGCKHENADKVGFVSATCADDGYTGDLICTDCKKVLEKGEVISAKGHTLSDIKFVKEATCEFEGYTGDVICTVCGTVVTPGEVIPVTDHVPAENTFYSYDATCTQEGFTGDINCINCGTVLTPGEVIPVKEHEPAKELRRSYEPDCWEDGYSGDVVCENCGIVLEEGKVIPTEGHKYGEPEQAVEPTCADPGYSGDLICTVCEHKEYGEEIPATGHKFNEQNTCETCGRRTPGLYIEDKMQMSWEELISSGYVMIRDDILTEINPVLVGDLVIGDEISKLSSEVARGSALSSVTIPEHVKDIPYCAFENNQNLETVTILGTVEELGSYAFSNCPKLTAFPFAEGMQIVGTSAFAGSGLKEIHLPGSVTKIYEHAFEECQSLETVVLEEGLERICYLAFSGCTGLKELTLPKTLTEIQNDVFKGSGIKELTFQDAFKNLGTLCEMENLTRVDLSRSEVTSMDDTFQNDSALEEVILPEKLNKMTIGCFENCSNLKYLALPKGFQELDDNWTREGMSTMTGVTTVVWPESLTDGKYLAMLPNLKLVLFTGNEFQWNMVANKELFQNKVVIKEAEYATGEELKEEILKYANELFDGGDLANAAELFELVPEQEGAAEKLADDSLKTAVQEAKYSVGHVITLGKFEQDNNEEDGAEEIEWMILDQDGDKRLVLSVYDLAVMQYSESDPGFFGITWKDSSVRSWLNQTFYAQAFDKEEKAAILDTEVVPDKFENSNAVSGSSTTDKVFCLNIGQVQKYFPDLQLALAVPTEYAIANGAYRNGDYNNTCEWWLCAPGNDVSNAACMMSRPEISEESVQEYDNCVRPAMWIDLSVLNK